MIGRGPNVEPARLLIVDDNQDFAENLADLARFRGMEPTVVGRLDDAQQLIEREEYDVALIDHRLPDGAGLNLLATARERRPNMVCVVITAFASLSATLGALNEGAFAFVTKDSDPDAFLDAMHRAAQTAFLRRENERLTTTQRRILLAIPDILILVDNKMRVLSVNQEHPIFCPTIDGLPRPLREVVSARANDRVDWERLIEQAADGESEEAWLRLRDEEDRTRTFAIRGSLVSGDPSPSYLIRVSEMTARLELERRLSESESLAKVGRLVAVIAHEMRNPLTGIRALAQLLKRRYATTDATDDLENVDEILALADRMSATLADLLAYSRPPRWNEVEVDLASLLTEVVRQANRWPAAEARSIDLRLPSNARPKVRGEQDRLASVFSNLLENALQATPEGGKVEVTLEASGTLRIEDTGKGVPEKDRDRIFDPFVTGRQDGTGLGLSIVKNVIEGYGGTISVDESASLGGAQFTVALPAI